MHSLEGVIKSSIDVIFIVEENIIN